MFRSCVMTLYCLAKRTRPENLIAGMHCTTRTIGAIKEGEKELDRILSYLSTGWDINNLFIWINRIPFTVEFLKIQKKSKNSKILLCIFSPMIASPLTTFQIRRLLCYQDMTSFFDATTFENSTLDFVAESPCRRNKQQQHAGYNKWWYPWALD